MTPRSGRRIALAALVAALGGLLGGCGPIGGATGSPSGAAGSGAASSGAATPAAGGTVPSAATALVALDALPVKAFALVDGYSRGQFGQRWADVDRNGCDTRNDVLRRDLADVVVDPGTDGCVVRSGRLTDPYTGEVRPFLRGEQTSPLVTVDHVVALAAAWRTGAASWSARRREEFANDPLNLLTVTRETNEDKAAGDAARWLPPLSAARCPFVARQVAVKARYRLSVTPQEKAAIRAVLDRCRT
jgi:hypothetical protein